MSEDVRISPGEPTKRKEKGEGMANLIRRNEPGRLERSRAIDPFELMREMMEWDPFRELGTLRSAPGLAFVPPFEVKETKDGYVFKADLPGLKEKDLDISLTGNRLTVSGTREEEKKEEDERFYAYERSYGTFSRSFTLPEGVDPNSVDAELKEGVLTIHMAKKPEVKAKRIELSQGKGGKAEKAHA
jgi:HSP20 family protein